MTIEEKMEHFKNVSLENASSQSNAILTAYKKSLEEQFETYKETSMRDAKVLEDKKLTTVKLDAKRELSRVQAALKHSVSNHQNQMKSEIFSQVRKKLTEYKQTENYRLFLIRRIKSILADYSDAPVNFYIDPSDADMLDFLRHETSADIQVSRTSFIGGLVAVIKSKNILIDNSFKTKLSEEQDNFSISF